MIPSINIFDVNVASTNVSCNTLPIIFSAWPSFNYSSLHLHSILGHTHAWFIKMSHFLCITESSEDIAIGNVTFEVGSSINEVKCADIEVFEDNTLESVEEFSLYVSNSIVLIEEFNTSDVTPSGMVEVSEFFLLTLPCENASIRIDTSDTAG